MKELTIRLVRIPEPGDGSSPLRKPRKRSAKPKKKLPNVVWTKEVTKEKIKQATNKNECLECGLKLGEGKTGAKRVAMHIKQHFTKMYCFCGFHSQSGQRVPPPDDINSRGTPGRRAENSWGRMLISLGLWVCQPN